LLNELIHKKKVSSNINSVLDNGISLTDPKQIAEKFNEFFANVAVDISERINPPSPAQVDQELNEPNEGRLFNMTQIPIQQAEIIDSIKNLNATNSLDPNDISMKVLKKLGRLIATPLLYIFNKSLQTSIYPEKFKIAKIVPIFKEGNPELTTNYRPISLLCNFSKIFEKIVHTRLAKHLESQNFLSESQFGFRKGHSTTHPMTHLLNYAFEAFNNKKHVAAIFCDLSKAFDTCDPKVMRKKLRQVGVMGGELDWFLSYLTDRQQYVYIAGHKSGLLPVRLGVPQGSILGPLLFLIYINDLPGASSLNTKLFADDTALLASDSDVIRLERKLNEEFQKICTYFRANRLSLNPKKTKFIIFSNSQQVQNYDFRLFANNNNTNQFFPENIFEISRVKDGDSIPAIKYLGVFFDPTLNFKYHTEQISKKLSRALYAMRNAKQFLNEKALKTLYYSLFHCHVIYAIEIWSVAPQSSLAPIFKKQKDAIRLLSNARYNAHTQPLFKRNEILPLSDLSEYFKLKLCQSILQNFSPISLRNMLQTNLEKRQEQGENNNLHLRNDGDLFIPTFRTLQLEKFPPCILPKLWNTLPPEVQIIRRKRDFDVSLKDWFLSKIPEDFVCNRMLCPSCLLNNVQ